MRRRLKVFVENFELYFYIWFSIKFSKNYFPFAKRVSVAVQFESLPNEDILYMMAAIRRDLSRFNFSDFTKKYSYSELPGRWQLSISDCFVDCFSPEQAKSYFEKYIAILNKRVEGSIWCEEDKGLSIRKLVIEGHFAKIAIENDVFDNVCSLVGTSSMDDGDKKFFVKELRALEAKFWRLTNDCG